MPIPLAALRSLPLLLLACCLPASAALALDGVSATFAVTQDWGTGCTAGVTITNPDSTRALADWRLSFSLAGTVTAVGRRRTWTTRTARSSSAGRLERHHRPGRLGDRGPVRDARRLAAPADLGVTGTWCTDCTTTTTTTTTTADSRITADRDGPPSPAAATPRCRSTPGSARRAPYLRQAVTAVTARNPDVAG